LLLSVSLFVLVQPQNGGGLAEETDHGAEDPFKRLEKQWKTLVSSSVLS
jgi:hypothetical protein